MPTPVEITVTFRFRIIVTLRNGEKWAGKWTDFEPPPQRDEMDRDDVFADVAQRLGTASGAIGVVVEDETGSDRYRVFMKSAMAYCDIEVTEVYGP